MVLLVSQPASLHLGAPFTATAASHGVCRRPTAGVFRYRKLATTSGSTLKYCKAISTGKDYSCGSHNDDDIHKVRELVELIKYMFQSMDDGDISVSPYDTAWVALVEDGGGPQFPESLDWISSNQLPDGSWGDDSIFLIYDRLLNTLACVVALKSWSMHPDKTNKGILFIKQNMQKLEDENADHMPIGFEVVFPSLLAMAKKLQIDVPQSSTGLQEIYARRELKFTMIPREIMHEIPTSLLFSLEGMSDLNWEKLMKFQCVDGSFLFSPASTAYALQQTKDDKCLKYLQNCVGKFNGGVPNSYPVDMFEHMWAVDRLQKLGISRYFHREIEECIEYVHRHWTNEGVFAARDSEIKDVDDTSMGFRLMRLLGYDVSEDVFKNYEKGGEFFCFAGQSSNAVTGMYNLYRASQLRFPGENILRDAADYAANFLTEKRAKNELFDKWIITKDLPGEVGYALDVPWYASLPRLEARFYMEQYGREDDVWIGKTLYRMPYVNNNTYLELAKLDYNICRDMHLREWNDLQRWYRDCNLEEFGLNEKSVLQGYYIAAACLFEPEKREERVAWAKTTILAETIVAYFEQKQLSREQKHEFVMEFENVKCIDFHRYKTTSSLVGILATMLDQLSMNISIAHDHDIHLQLNHAWHEWLKKQEEGDAAEGEVELFVHVLNLCGGVSDELLLFHPKYEQLLKTTVTVCHQLRLLAPKARNEENKNTTEEIESNMQVLAKSVLTKSPGDLNSLIKQNFLTIAKSFYYKSYFNPMTIDSHINKVLIERVA